MPAKHKFPQFHITSPPPLAFCAKSFSHVRLFLTWTRLLCPWEFSRQEYWSGLPFPFPENLPNIGIKPSSPTFQVHSLLSEPPGKPYHISSGD